MKIIGLMCVKDEADLLPQVYPHIRSLVDYLYVYEDGSQDDTWNYAKDADYAIRKIDDKSRLDIARPNYHHLLEKIKKDFKNEKDIWCVICMGDRFFLSKTPRQIAEEGSKYGAVEAIQLDFLRHRSDPWTEKNDFWPDMSNIRNFARWIKFDERCIIAFKLQRHLSYLNSKYPWPRGLQSMPIQYNHGEMEGKINREIPYLEHQGRRTPKAAMWRFNSGSRKRSTKKNLDVDFSSFEKVIDTQKRFYLPYKVLPYINLNSLDKLIELENNENWKDPVQRRYFFWGIEHQFQQNNCQLPPREDL